MSDEVYIHVLCRDEAACDLITVKTSELRSWIKWLCQVIIVELDIKYIRQGSLKVNLVHQERVGDAVREPEKVEDLRHGSGGRRG